MCVLDPRPRRRSCCPPPSRPRRPSGRPPSILKTHWKIPPGSRRGLAGGALWVNRSRRPGRLAHRDVAPALVLIELAAGWPLLHATPAPAIDLHLPIWGRGARRGLLAFQTLRRHGHGDGAAITSQPIDRDFLGHGPLWRGSGANGFGREREHAPERDAHGECPQCAWCPHGWHAPRQAHPLPLSRLDPQHHTQGHEDGHHSTQMPRAFDGEEDDSQPAQSLVCSSDKNSGPLPPFFEGHIDGVT
jgi:hypothetical protein